MERPSSPEHGTQYWQARHTETGEIFDSAMTAFEYEEGPMPLGLYEHYKSTAASPMRYHAEAFVRNIETDELFVLYHTADPSKHRDVYIRPYDMFFEMVESGTVIVPRFRYVG